MKLMSILISLIHSLSRSFIFAVSNYSKCVKHNVYNTQVVLRFFHFKGFAQSEGIEKFPTQTFHLLSTSFPFTFHLLFKYSLHYICFSVVPRYNKPQKFNEKVFVITG